jgi:NAD(P)H dehydrogenase (quinone)
VNGASRRDYAEAAAAVITMEAQEGRVYELAGDPALSYPEIAARIGGLLETRAVPAAPNIFPYSRAGAIAEA